MSHVKDPYRGGVSETRVERILRQFKEAMQQIDACRCRHVLVREGPHTYGKTITDECPVHGDRARLKRKGLQRNGE